jgi:hypothetical protein
MERERYGRGRGGGINRYPDVSGRTGGGQPSGGRAFERDERPRGAPRPSGSAEPWSEVPPELEAMLRAQVGQRPTVPTARPTETGPVKIDVDEGALAEGADAIAEAPSDAEAGIAKPKRTTKASTAKPRATKTKATDAEADAEAPKPKRRTTTRAKTSEGAAAGSPEATPDGEATEPEATAPKRRTTRRTTTKTSS